MLDIINTWIQITTTFTRLRENCCFVISTWNIQWYWETLRARRLINRSTTWLINFSRRNTKFYVVLPAFIVQTNHWQFFASCLSTRVNSEDCNTRISLICSKQKHGWLNWSTVLFFTEIHATLLVFCNYCSCGIV